MALFWTENADVVPEICWSHSPSIEFTTTGTTGATLAFTFQSFSFGFWCFSNFLYSFLILLSLDTTTSIPLLLLVYYIIPGWLAGTCLSVWIWKTHRILVCLSPLLSVESSILSWEYLTHLLCRCSYTPCQQIDCAVQCILFLSASYTLSLYVGLSLNTLCSVCTSCPV